MSPASRERALRDLLFAWCIALAAASSRPSGAQETWLVSRDALDPSRGGNARSEARAISSDGRFVVFVSAATNLVAGGKDSNGLMDVFHWDRATREVTLISHNHASPAQAANGVSDAWSLSDDGRFVVIASLATDLVAGLEDENQASDAFLWDRNTGQLSLISHAAGQPAVTANARVSFPRITRNGRWTHFDSGATNLVAGVNAPNGGAYLFDQESGALRLISHAHGSPTQGANAGAAFAAVTEDGEFALLFSSATDLVPSAPSCSTCCWTCGQTFLWSEDTDSVVLVSRSTSSPVDASNWTAEPVAISADGRYVSFHSAATDLIVGSGFWGNENAYVWDRLSGASTLVSHWWGSATHSANRQSQPVSISDDGRFLVLVSTSWNMIEGTPQNNTLDAFRWQREANSVELASRVSGFPELEGNGASYPLAASADGRFVAYDSHATNLQPEIGDINEGSDVYVWDGELDSLFLVSHAFDNGLATANAASALRSISRNGGFVLFDSSASNLLPKALEPSHQVFVRFHGVFADGFETGDPSRWSPQAAPDGSIKP